jgi:hypothetical protein
MTAEVSLVSRRATVTIFLKKDGRLEDAQQMARDESHTTKLYDPAKGEITLSNVNRIPL